MQKYTIPTRFVGTVTPLQFPSNISQFHIKQTGKNRNFTIYLDYTGYVGKLVRPILGWTHHNLSSKVTTHHTGARHCTANSITTKKEKNSTWKHRRHREKEHTSTQVTQETQYYVPTFEILYFNFLLVMVELINIYLKKKIDF